MGTRVPADPVLVRAFRKLNTLERTHLSNLANNDPPASVLGNFRAVVSASLSEAGLQRKTTRIRARQHP